MSVFIDLLLITRYPISDLLPITIDNLLTTYFLLPFTTYFHYPRLPTFITLDYLISLPSTTYFHYPRRPTFISLDDDLLSLPSTTTYFHYPRLRRPTFREYPDANVYDTPAYFRNDWLNEYLDAVATPLEDSTAGDPVVKDDYRFVYIGCRGSFTPFHSDVLRSHSWSANICGRKLWTFYSPGYHASLVCTPVKPPAPPPRSTPSRNRALNHYYYNYNYNTIIMISILLTTKIHGDYGRH